MSRIYTTDSISLKKIMVDRRLDKISDLSAETGVDRNTLAKVVNGKIQPSAPVMDKLVFALKIDARDAGKIFFYHKLT